MEEGGPIENSAAAAVVSNESRTGVASFSLVSQKQANSTIPAITTSDHSQLKDDGSTPVRSSSTLSEGGILNVSSSDNDEEYDDDRKSFLDPDIPWESLQFEIEPYTLKFTADVVINTSSSRNVTQNPQQSSPLPPSPSELEELSDTVELEFVRYLHQERWKALLCTALTLIILISMTALLLRNTEVGMILVPSTYLGLIVATIAYTILLWKNKRSGKCATYAQKRSNALYHEYVTILFAVIIAMSATTWQHSKNYCRGLPFDEKFDRCLNSFGNTSFICLFTGAFLLFISPRVKVGVAAVIAMLVGFFGGRAVMGLAGEPDHVIIGHAFLFAFLNIGVAAYCYLRERALRQFFLSLVKAEANKRRTEVLFDSMKDLIDATFPPKTARQLIRGEEVMDVASDAGVVCCTMPKFTEWCSTRSAPEIHAALEECFMTLDRLCSQNKVTKISSFGDTYIAVAGLLVYDKNAAIHAVSYSAKALKELQKIFNEPSWRVCVSGGDIVGTVVGKSKNYVIFGDGVDSCMLLLKSSYQCGLFTTEDIRIILSMNISKRSLSGRSSGGSSVHKGGRGSSTNALTSAGLSWGGGGGSNPLVAASKVSSSSFSPKADEDDDDAIIKWDDLTGDTTLTEESEYESVGHAPVGFRIADTSLNSAVFSGGGNASNRSGGTSFLSERKRTLTREEAVAIQHRLGLITHDDDDNNDEAPDMKNTSTTNVAAGVSGGAAAFLLLPKRDLIWTHCGLSAKFLVPLYEEVYLSIFSSEYYFHVPGWIGTLTSVLLVTVLLVLTLYISPSEFLYAIISFTMSIVAGIMALFLSFLWRRDLHQTGIDDDDSANNNNNRPPLSPRVSPRRERQRGRGGGGKSLLLLGILTTNVVMFLAFGVGVLVSPFPSLMNSGIQFHVIAFSCICMMWAPVRLGPSMSWLTMFFTVYVPVAVLVVWRISEWKDVLLLTTVTLIAVPLITLLVLIRAEINMKQYFINEMEEVSESVSLRLWKLQLKRLLSVVHPSGIDMIIKHISSKMLHQEMSSTTHGTEGGIEVLSPGGGGGGGEQVGNRRNPPVESLLTKPRESSLCLVRLHFTQEHDVKEEEDDDDDHDGGRDGGEESDEDPGTNSDVSERSSNSSCALNNRRRRNHGQLHRRYRKRIGVVQSFHRIVEEEVLPYHPSIIKAKTSGDMLVFSGSTPSLNPMAMSNFAADLYCIVSEKKSQMRISCVLAFGPITPTVLGRSRVTFELLGDTVQTGLALLLAADSGSCIATDRYIFEYNVAMDEASCERAAGVCPPGGADAHDYATNGALLSYPSPVVNEKSIQDEFIKEVKEDLLTMNPTSLFSLSSASTVSPVSAAERLPTTRGGPFASRVSHRVRMSVMEYAVLKGHIIQLISKEKKSKNITEGTVATTTSPNSPPISMKSRTCCVAYMKIAENPATWKVKGRGKVSIYTMTPTRHAPL